MNSKNLIYLSLIVILTIVSLSGCNLIGETEFTANQSVVDDIAEYAYPGGIATEIPGSMVIDGENRTYTLVVPDPLPKKVRPLVLFFHGGETAAGWSERSQLKDLVSKNGWFIVYPQSGANGDKTWESGGTGPRSDQPKMGFSDFKFVETMIEQFAAQYPINKERVLAAGFSNGAQFINRLVCQRGHLLRGFISTGASRTLPANQEGCPALPMHALLVGGTSDGSSPFDCPTPEIGCDTRGGPFIGVVQTAESWAEINQCSATPVVTAWPIIPTYYPINESKYGPPCVSGKQVTMLEVVGMGHRWPTDINQDDLSAEWIQNWLINASK